MKKNRYFIPFISLTSGLLTCGVPIFAAPVAWDLAFYDEAGAVTGSGAFSYNTDTSICLPHSPPPNPCTHSPVPSGFTDDRHYVSSTVTTVLDSISISLGDVSWGSADNNPMTKLSGFAWWVDSTVNHGSRMPTRGGDQNFKEWLFLDDRTRGYSRLVMTNFTMVSNCRWSGHWKGHKPSDVPRGTGNPIVELGEGMFTATKVNCTVSETLCPAVPRFSLESGLLDIPTVMVEETPYAVKMQLDPASVDVMTFSVTDVQAQ